MKKKFAAVLAACIVFTNSFNVFSQEINTTINSEVLLNSKKEVVLQVDNTLAVINGVEKQLSTLPKVLNGTTYLPLRFIVDELLEANLEWHAVEKKASITRGDKKVEVKIESTEGFLNGERIILLSAPITDGGITYLPLRAMSSLFDIEVSYDEATKKITLVKESESNESVVDISPTVFAHFSFDQPRYTEGQEVKVIDESFDETGEAIVDRVWKVNFNEKQTSRQLENIFKVPKVGTYAISLKVRNAKGMWSAWITQQVVIHPNLKPVITKFETSKKSFAQGEKLEFTYEYENEVWENIKAERWTYREFDEPLAKSVVDKPQFIFDEGKYIVTLQLQDDAGNWSDRQETVVFINEQAGQKELEFRFTKGSIGDIIDNFKDFNYQNYKEITPSVTTFGEGSLMMSDSPESVKAVGILYKDTLEGPGRILIHHSNEFTEEENARENKRLVLMAENKTDEPANFVIANRIIKGPAEDALYVGQQQLLAYLRGDGYNSYTLNPGEKMYIYDSGARRWGKNQLISGKMDFFITGKVTFTVAAIGKNTTMDEIEGLPKLQKDIHPRGTFGVTDIYHQIELMDNEPTKLLLGKDASEWIEGYDAITGEVVKNRGNFGITYHLKITAKQDIGLILNPRGGIFRGAIKWDGNKTYLAPSKGFFSGHNSKAVMIGTMKAGETRTLEYILPNGSASPVLIGFIPKSYWNK